MMSLSRKGISTNSATPNTGTKTKTLNPNAAEFVPSSLRYIPGSTNSGEVSSRTDSFAPSGKTVIDRSESSISNNSDDEAHQYWRQHLPDDITPDFKFMEENESQGPGSLSFQSLSINDLGENYNYAAPIGSQNTVTGKLRYSATPYVANQSSAAFVDLPINPWEKQFINADQLLSNGSEGFPYNGSSGTEFINDVFNEHTMSDDSEINPVEFLASQFPGFAAESLAEVYYANGCDLNLTIEMLTQLELQVESGFNQNLNSKTLSAPNLSAMDFPALSESDGQNGLEKYAEDLQQSTSPYRSADKDNLLLFKTGFSAQPRGATDFASAVKKPAPPTSGLDRYGSANSSVGSSRSSQILAGSYGGGQGRATYGDRSENYVSARKAPVWLETGEAVGNMYSEFREEARDHARLRNAYFEQARQAYLIGNKALAKELSVKGQLYNMHMKAAHAKAQEAIYRQRNTAHDVQAYGRGQERMIDLHGLHVNEAIHRLRNELSILRSAARSTDQRLQVFICVGTGHHTKGSRTPARLPVAVEQYLLKEEGLEYTEPQPGLLRVVIY